eukprot:TRINITY_DN105926_c0_g1_i1.p1 TRINITY_DN105926_c0_g1~~TRINITY_DN105926_c0_g1_i1.p1  ORF type:complete len:413 (-),score=73.47 TRINITY_DN105926_c0_g1_i1:93-1331(-)
MSDGKLLAIASQCKSIFRRFDLDSSGCISEKEFIEVLRQCDESLCEEQLQYLFRQADKNFDGSIQYEEFIDFIWDLGGNASDLQRKVLGIPVLEGAKHSTSVENIKQMILAQIDQDKDGKLNRKEVAAFGRLAADTWFGKDSHAEAWEPTPACRSAESNLNGYTDDVERSFGALAEPKFFDFVEQMFEEMIPTLIPEHKHESGFLTVEELLLMYGLINDRAIEDVEFLKTCLMSTLQGAAVKDTAYAPNAIQYLEGMFGIRAVNLTPEELFTNEKGRSFGKFVDIFKQHFCDDDGFMGFQQEKELLKKAKHLNATQPYATYLSDGEGMIDDHDWNLKEDTLLPWTFFLDDYSAKRAGHASSPVREAVAFLTDFLGLYVWDRIEGNYDTEKDSWEIPAAVVCRYFENVAAQAC